MTTRHSKSAVPLALGLALAAVLNPSCGDRATAQGGSPDGGTADTDSDTDTDSDGDGGAPSFALTSSAFEDGGTLPVDYTCDGAGVTPPLAWTDAPEGTTELALLMTTESPDGTKWNWVLYGIPGDTTSLAEGATGVGTLGLTSDGPDLAYSPPCSQGPGPKEYTFTVYALSGSPAFSVPADEVDGATVIDAISSLTLASAAISATYSREFADGGAGDFALTSSAFADGDTLPVQYTCDGAGDSPPLAWTGVPAGTTEFAMLLTTVAVDGTRYNWVLYGIPGDATSLAANTAVGTCGLTSDGADLRYYAPCPGGPGMKTYTFTLYALSASPEFSVSPDQIDGQALTDAIVSITLASAAIDVDYGSDTDGGSAK